MKILIVLVDISELILPFCFVQFSYSMNILMLILALYYLKNKNIWILQSKPDSKCL